MDLMSVAVAGDSGDSYVERGRKFPAWQWFWSFIFFAMVAKVSVFTIGGKYNKSFGGALSL